MPNRQLEAARLARQRELHLERLAAIELRPRKASGYDGSSGGTLRPGDGSGGALRAGGGPPRPWTQRPPQKAADRRPTSAQPRTSGVKLTFEQREHQRHVASLYSKLQRVAVGTEWRQREHEQKAMATGRAQHTTAPARRRVQQQTAVEADKYYKILRHTSARFASPSAIALLTGKSPPGAAGADEGEGEEGD